MNAIHSRFLTALAIVVVGAALTVGAFTLSSGSERWVGLGVGAAGLITLAGAFASHGRGSAQRILDGVLALICAWTIVCARVIESSGAGSSAHAVKWFNFAAGAAITSFGLIGLLIHERRIERELAAQRARAEALEASARLALERASESRQIENGDQTADGRYASAISRTAG